MSDETRGTVLLYSGGMDSEAARLLLDPDVLVHVNLGTRYSGVEQEVVPRLLDSGRGLVRPPVLEVVDLEAVARWERPDGIVPLRNLMLVCVGAQYGHRVALAATAGDRVLDKSYEFAARATGLLGYLWQPQHWTKGKTVEVELPVKHLSKRGLVDAVQVRHGVDGVAQLARSWSCYDPQWPVPDSPVACGRCKPCRRKWVAFAAEGHLPGLDHTRGVPNALAAVREHELAAIEAGRWGRGEAEAQDVLAAVRQATA